MDVAASNPVIPTVARAVTLPIQAINPLVPGDGVITLPLPVAPEPVHKSSASDHHTQSGADGGAAGRTSAFAAATVNANADAEARSASGRGRPSALPPVVVPDTSSAASAGRGFNLYA